MKSRLRNKLVYGVGINDADYDVNHYITVDGKQKLIWRCPYYQVWRHMLERCYSSKYQERQKSYKDCSVCCDWLNLSKFKAWMEQQDWEGKQLDKDIIYSGNKLYSPATCVFVDQSINLFLVDRAADRGDWPIGVYYNKGKQKFMAQCRNPFTGKSDYLGLYSCSQEAHQSWLKRKLELAKLLAAKQDDPRVAKALIHRYENYEQ